MGITISCVLFIFLPVRQEYAAAGRLGSQMSKLRLDEAGKILLRMHSTSAAPAPSTPGSEAALHASQVQLHQPSVQKDKLVAVHLV